MFLKMDTMAVPVESVSSISIVRTDDTIVENVEGGTVKRKKPALKLRIEFRDGSAWMMTLSPEPKDKDAFLEKLCREIGRRMVTDVPAVVRKLLDKEVRK